MVYMTSTQIPSLILRLICAAGFIHGKATSPANALGGQFVPAPFGPSYHGANAGQRLAADHRAWKAEESRLQGEWAGRQAERRSHLLDAHRSACINLDDAALASLEAAEAILTDWDPQARTFAAARNPWIAVARRCIEGALTEADEKLIAAKLDRCLANAAAAKAAR